MNRRNKPIELMALENKFNEQQRIIYSLKQENEKLRLELSCKEEQMNKLIELNVQLSMDKLNKSNKKVNAPYVGYMTLD